MTLTKIPLTMKDFYIGLDFDGTVVKHEYPYIGKDIGAIQWLEQWQEAGAKIILNTMRSGERLKDAVNYLQRTNGIELFGINQNPTQTAWTQSPKVYAHLYIDDAAFGCPLTSDGIGRPFVNWDIVGPSVLNLILLGETEEIVLPGKIEHS